MNESVNGLLTSADILLIMETWVHVTHVTPVWGVGVEK